MTAWILRLAQLLLPPPDGDRIGQVAVISTLASGVALVVLAVRL